MKKWVVDMGGVFRYIATWDVVKHGLIAGFWRGFGVLFIVGRYSFLKITFSFPSTISGKFPALIS
jgi:hypothetical protein